MHALLFVPPVTQVMSAFVTSVQTFSFSWLILKAHYFHRLLNLIKSRWSIVINSVALYCCLFVLPGMTAVICTYPLDVVRARLAFQVTGFHRYTGIANAFHTIYLKVVFNFSNTRHSLHKQPSLALKKHENKMPCMIFNARIFLNVVNNL